MSEPLDVARIAKGADRCAVVPRLRHDRLGDVDLAVEHVARDFEIARAVGARETFPRRHGDHVGDALGRHHRGREFGDRLHHVDVRKVLQAAHLPLGEGALATDVQNRALRAESRGDAGDRVGAAGAGGGDDAAEFAGLARIAVGGVRRGLLVAHVDDADALVQAAVVDVDDVAAAQREDCVDPFRLERLGDQVAARNDVGVGALALQRVFSGRRFRLLCLQCCFSHGSPPGRSLGSDAVARHRLREVDLELRRDRPRRLGPGATCTGIDWSGRSARRGRATARPDRRRREHGSRGPIGQRAPAGDMPVRRGPLAVRPARGERPARRNGLENRGLHLSPDNRRSAARARRGRAHGRAREPRRAPCRAARAPR